MGKALGQARPFGNRPPSTATAPPVLAKIKMLSMMRAKQACSQFTHIVSLHFAKRKRNLEKSHN
ncbi:MAG: hypothetical protein ACLRWC_09720 [Acutalibacter sp.]